MLLALRNEKGTIATCFSEYAVAGAILAELSLERRISFDATGKRLVDLEDPGPMGDPLIDECLEKLAAAKRRASLQTWVPRLAGIKDLKHKVARQLCDRGILRAEENKVLFVFTRKDYPEVNPVPEKRIVDRVRAARCKHTGNMLGNRIRHFARNRDETAAFGIVVELAGEKRARVRVPRRAQDFRDRPCLHNHAAVHHAHVVAQLRDEAQVVGDEDDRAREAAAQVALGRASAERDRAFERAAQLDLGPLSVVRGAALSVFERHDSGGQVAFCKEQIGLHQSRSDYERTGGEILEEAVQCLQRAVGIFRPHAQPCGVETREDRHARRAIFGPLFEHRLGGMRLLRVDLVETLERGVEIPAGGIAADEFLDGRVGGVGAVEPQRGLGRAERRAEKHALGEPLRRALEFVEKGERFREAALQQEQPAFETEMAAYLGTRRACGVASGTRLGRARENAPWAHVPTLVTSSRASARGARGTISSSSWASERPPCRWMQAGCILRAWGPRRGW
jgi:hypothetical protein